VNLVRKALPPAAAAHPLPLLQPFLAAGIAGGVAAAIAFHALFAGMAVLSLFVAMGLTWRRDEPPVFPFVIAHQWVYVVVGDLTRQWVPGFGAERYVVDATRAVSLAMCGFVALALGIRLAAGGRPPARAAAPDPEYHIPRLFFLTIAAYAINWVLQLAGAAIFFNAANLINNVLLARAALLCLLWIAIVRQRRGFLFGFAALLFVVIPSLGSTQSKFKEAIFLSVVALLAGWRPWVRNDGQRRLNRGLMVALAGLTALMIMAGAFWEGGVKAPWRALGGESDATATARSSSTLGKLAAFDGVVRQAAGEFELGHGFRQLARRVDSIGQLALVLERVPDSVPHENGALTWRAAKHLATPRLLFPNKENLGDDSWLAATYAGISAGKDTSIGIGYMAEFYVDFGFGGMMAALVVMGAVLSGLSRFLRRASPSAFMGHSVVVVCIVTYFSTFESNLAKLMGGLVVNVLVLWVLLAVFGPMLHRWLLRKGRDARRALPAVKTKGRLATAPSP
jgi:hypothetical protein